MATPYFQMRRGEVPSTQDVARDNVGDLPLLVLAHSQTSGRGRTGASWENADRALAASLAVRVAPGDRRPFSLIAGVGASRLLSTIGLKWPNDVMVDGRKAGGILVERSGEVTVIGLGLNIYWRDPPEGMTGLHGDDPGPHRYLELGGLWGAELMQLLEMPEWPLEEYRTASVTLGQRIAWEPDGSGTAVDIADDGALLVNSGEQTRRIYSGEVRHVRPSP